MKVIFLDIDGVLNSAVYDRIRSASDSNIDESRLQLIRHIVEETGAKIVLSSTWRRHWERDAALCDEIGIELNQIFGKHGLTIYSKTPQIAAIERGEEVQAWLDLHEKEIENFVILDDTFFGWGISLYSHLVKTDYRIGRGLEEKHMQKAIAILNEDK